MSPSNFNPTTPKIELIAKDHSAAIEQIKGLFLGKTKVYIDYANVRPWSEKLQWNVDLKRLMQLLRSFDNVDGCSWYQGTLVGDKHSEDLIKDAQACGLRVVTKPVKIMYQSIDVSSISLSSPELLKKFIRNALLLQLDVATVEFLNKQLKSLNDKGIISITDRKCNFDVEIGVDMLLDLEHNDAETFVLWSGDSDFADPISRILQSGHKVVLFASPRLVSRELSLLVKEGLFIFDIQKIKDFICWKRELAQKYRTP